MDTGNDLNRKQTVRTPIDTGGLLQFITGIKEQSPTLLFECVLDRNVDRDRLLDALEKALDVFSSFKVRIGIDDRKCLFYEENPNTPQVYEYDGKQHFFGKKSGGYLFRLYYSADKVFLSAHHMLSDFHGAYTFMKCILSFYFGLDYRNLIDLDPEDLRDPYELHGSREPVSLSQKDKWKNEIIIPHNMKFRRGEIITVNRLSFSLTEILRRTKKAESSVFPLLSWLIAKAVAKEYDGEDSIILGAGGFDCRSVFDSKTPRCFSHSFITVLHPDEKTMDIEQQLTVQKARMFLELDEGSVANDIAFRKETADIRKKQAEQLILDQDSSDIRRKRASQDLAFFNSYAGRFGNDTELSRHVKDIDMLGAVTRNPILGISYSIGDTVYCNLEETGSGKTIVPAVIETAGENGLTCSLLRTVQIRMDTFPMEELFDD